MRSVPREQIIARIQAENPWWRSGVGVPSPYADWQPRSYITRLLPLVRDRVVRRAVVLMGPRRVGKTVLIHHVIAELLSEGTSPQRLCYISVDHPLFNGVGLDDFIDLASEAAGTNLRSSDATVFFDEIQYLKQWENHVKVLVDSHSRLKVLVSGSAAAALKLKSSESGAGRMTDFLLPPLTFKEYLALRDRDDLVDQQTDAGSPRCRDLEGLNAAFIDYLNFGGYPEVLESKSIRSDVDRYIKQDIIDKVLLRDLPQLYGIEDIQELNSLFTTLAFNTAGEVSLQGLSQGAGIGKNTIKKYMEYLQAAFLIRRVSRVDQTAKRFKRERNFKVYLTNPSMRAALFAPLSPDDPEFGSLVETGIFSQWFHASFDLHYARWKGGREVDIVSLTPDQRVDWAVEVKWSDRIVDHLEELKPLIRFCRTNGIRAPLITTRTVDRVVPLDGVQLRFRPAALYAYQLGANIIASRDGRSP